MSFNNRAMLRGYCSETPKLKYTATGTPMVALAIYTHEEVNNEVIDEVHRCLFFGKKALYLAEKAEKGRHMMLDGMIRTKRVGEGKNAKYYTSIVVEYFKLSPRQPLGALRDYVREIVKEKNITDVSELAIFEGCE